MTDETRRRPGWRRWTGLAVVAVLLPLLATLVLIWTTDDRRDQIGTIPVAIVNDDKIITDPRPMAAGRALASSLIHPEDADPQLDWTITDPDDASEGLRTGSYYAVLTIPSDFSKAILSTSTNTPESGQLQLTSNAAASQTVPYISKQVVAAAAQALGEQSTQAYLKQVYAGFNQIADGQQTAAKSARQLADGTSQLAQGAGDLDSGAQTLAGAVAEIAAGTVQLEKGTAALAGGTARVQEGATALAAGARRTSHADDELANGVSRLAGRAQVYAERSAQVATGASVLARVASGVSDGADRHASRLATLSSECLAEGGSARFCADLREVRVGSRALALGVRALDRGTTGIARAQSALRDGARALAAADRAAATSARRLADASGRLATSAGELANGARDVAGGAGTLDTSTGQLVLGTRDAAQGADSLASGSDTLSRSAVQVDDGADQLSDGLAKGAEQAPTYAKPLQDALASTVSEPVQLTSTIEHDSDANGFLVGAVVGVLIWLAALAGATRMDTTAARRLALAPVSSSRIARSQAGPVVVLALVQGAVVVLALVAGGVSMASAAGVAAISLLAAVSFGIVAYAMRLGGGATGIAVFVLLLLVQIAALSNVVPLETAPALLQRLNGLMPLTAYANATTRLISGGEIGSLVGPVVVLVAWGSVAFVSTTLIVKRGRTFVPTPDPTGAGRAVATNG